MAKGNNQKFKFARLCSIMLEKTDEEHPMTLPQIQAELEKYEITSERKSLYKDFQDMQDEFGIDLIKNQVGRETYYYVGSRDFELAEVKLLIDAVQSSRFVSQAKSRELIAKIKKLVSEHQAKKLQRQIYITNRVKTGNEKIFYSVDDIYAAIDENRKIRFQYYSWDISKKLVPRHKEGVIASPWALVWNDENYYLVAYDDKDSKMKHYRVDKMAQIERLEEERAGREAFEQRDMAKYTDINFSMYGGEIKTVKIELDNSLCGVFLDRFGTDISFRPAGAGRSTITADVAVSNQFFGWVFSLGKQVKVVGPAEVVEEMRAAAADFAANYNA